MTTTIDVNVMATNLRERNWPGEPDKEYFDADFVYQQISPTNKIYVHENGDIILQALPNDAKIVFHWKSPQVIFANKLWPAGFKDPADGNFWVLKNNGKPKPSDSPTSTTQFTVSPGNPADKMLIVEDKNSDGGKYSYALAAWVEFDGGRWVVHDPKIINRGNIRFLHLSEGDDDGAAQSAD